MLPRDHPLFAENLRCFLPGNGGNNRRVLIGKFPFKRQLTRESPVAKPGGGFQQTRPLCTRPSQAGQLDPRFFQISDAILAQQAPFGNSFFGKSTENPAADTAKRLPLGTRGQKGEGRWPEGPEGIRTPQISEHSETCNISPPSFSSKMPPPLTARSTARGGFGGRILIAVPCPP